MHLFLPEPQALRKNFARDNFVIASTALLPSQAEEFRRRAKQISKIARPISRHQDGEDLVYRVVTGEQIRSRWSELFRLYTSEALRVWIKSVTAEPEIFISPELESGLNLNVMQDYGSVYQ